MHPIPGIEADTASVSHKERRMPSGTIRLYL
jgi:hypothetical protein